MKMKLAYTVASFHKIKATNFYLPQPPVKCMFATLDRHVFFYAHTSLGEHKNRDEGPV